MVEETKIKVNRIRCMKKICIVGECGFKPEDRCFIDENKISIMKVDEK